MTKLVRRGVSYGLLIALTAYPATCLADLTLKLERVATGLDQPNFVTHAPGEPGSIYFIEQGASGDLNNPISGKIKSLDLSSGTISTFLEISNMGAQGEQGLLGLAFHPDYATNGKFYVNYVENDPTDGVSDTKIVEYLRGVGANPPTVSKEVMTITQPFANHNAGWMAFSPQPTDPYLYISVGDGGGGSDPFRNGQNKSTLLGSMLRIDVNGDDFPADTTKNYAIPATNPFVGAGGTVKEEIWANGLRNTWRASFDQNGDLYMGNVGQRDWEEVNYQPANSTGGENYGWCYREGSDWANPNVISCNTNPNSIPPGNPPEYPDMVDPIHAFPRGTMAAITGGYVYRGPIPELDGKYIFAEYITGEVRTLEYDGTAPMWTDTEPGNGGMADITFDGTNFTGLETFNLEYLPAEGEIGQWLSSFGVDAAGNLYIVDYGDRDPNTFAYIRDSGQIYRVVGVPEPSAVWFCLLAIGMVFASKSRPWIAMSKAWRSS